MAPWPAVKQGLVSLAIVIAMLAGIDRIVLPRLERQWLTAGAAWRRHNTVVSEEGLKSATIDAFPGQKPMRIPAAGVVSWAGHPVSAEPPPGMKRVMVMGDSFVSGSPYLTHNHMWWRQLGQLLEEDSVEVIAVGRAGASTRDQLEWARYFVPRYKPNLIIWGYVSNDPGEGRIPQLGQGKHRVSPSEPLQPAWRAARRALPQVMAKVDGFRLAKLMKALSGPEHGYDYVTWELKILEPDNLAAYANTVREVDAFLDECGIPAFMITLPNFPSLAYFGPRYAPIPEVWREAGIAVHDILPAFIDRYGDMPLDGSAHIPWGINPADGHPSPLACRFHAEKAADIVRRDYPHVLGERRSSPASPVINDWLPHLEVTDAPRLAADGSCWTMRYPNDESRFPSMPLGIATPMIAFRSPMQLSSLTVAGPELASVQAWVMPLDAALTLDDREPQDLGTRRGPRATWELPPHLLGRRIGVIQFQATFSGPNREIAWTFALPGGPAP